MSEERCLIIGNNAMEEINSYQSKYWLKPGLMVGGSGVAALGPRVNERSQKLWCKGGGGWDWEE